MNKLVRFKGVPEIMSTNSRIPDCLQQIFAGFLSLRMRTVVSALQWRPGTVASSLLAISDSGACRAFEMLVHGLTESKSREKKCLSRPSPISQSIFTRENFIPHSRTFLWPPAQKYGLFCSLLNFLWPQNLWYRHLCNAETAISWLPFGYL